MGQTHIYGNGQTYTPKSLPEVPHLVNGGRQTPSVARPELSLNALDDSTRKPSVLAQARTGYRRGQQRTDGLAENPHARPQDEGWPGSHSQLPGTDLIGQLWGQAFSSQLLK